MGGVGPFGKKLHKQCCCPSNLCCEGRDLAGSLTLTLVYPGTGGGCGDTVLTLVQDIDGYWYADNDVAAEIPGGGGEECTTFHAWFRFFCDPGGPVYQLEWYYEYLGDRFPASGWCPLVKLSEDCTYPYLASWDENIPCAGGFWNGFYTYVVSE